MVSGFAFFILFWRCGCCRADTNLKTWVPGRPPRQGQAAHAAAIGDEQVEVGSGHGGRRDARAAARSFIALPNTWSKLVMDFDDHPSTYLNAPSGNVEPNIPTDSNELKPN